MSSLLLAQQPPPSDALGWAQVLVGAPVAVVVVLFALGLWRMLAAERLVLGREKQASDEENLELKKENRALREQLDVYRDKVEAEILPALIRATDTVSRVISREEHR